MSSMISIVYFLFSTVISLLTLTLWARIAIRYLRISPLHPISHTIARLTDPLVAPFATLIPIKTARQRYDWTALLVLFLVEFIRFTLIGFLFLNHMLPLLLIVLYALADLVVQPCNLLFYAILFRVILSWIQPGWRHPLAEVLYQITEPLLSMARRVLPQTMSIDFSPVVVIVVLKVITLLIGAFFPVHLL